MGNIVVQTAITSGNVCNAHSTFQWEMIVMQTVITNGKVGDDSQFLWKICHADCKQQLKCLSLFCTGNVCHADSNYQ